MGGENACKIYDIANDYFNKSNKSLIGLLDAFWYYAYYEFFQMWPPKDGEGFDWNGLEKD